MNFWRLSLWTLTDSVNKSFLLCEVKQHTCTLMRDKEKKYRYLLPVGALTHQPPLAIALKPAL